MAGVVAMDAAACAYMTMVSSPSCWTKVSPWNEGAAPADEAVFAAESSWGIPKVGCKSGGAAPALAVLS